MNRLHVIWQRDLSRGRYRDGGSDPGGAPSVYPREYEWICDLLRGFSLVHHPDGHFSTAIPGSVVVLEGQNYDVRSVRRYLRRFSRSGCRTEGVGLIHITDEFGKAPVELYADASFVYRNYWRAEIDRWDHCHYLPLGSNCPRDLFSPVPLAERPYRWSFAGQRKVSRTAMIEALEARTDGKLIATSSFNSGLSKEAYAQLLSNTQVVLCPRGWASVETYRFYEALDAGAVPLVEDDGGLDLLREHRSRDALRRMLASGPRAWVDFARRIPRGSYWGHAYGASFPCPRIFRWENIHRVIDTLDIARLQEKTSRWWRRYVQDLRIHIQDSVRASLGIEPSPDSDSSSVPREGIARRPSSPAPSG